MNQSCCKGITRSPEDDGSDFELVKLFVAVIEGYLLHNRNTDI